MCHAVSWKSAYWEKHHELEAKRARVGRKLKDMWEKEEQKKQSRTVKVRIWSSYHIIIVLIISEVRLHDILLQWTIHLYALRWAVFNTDERLTHMIADRLILIIRYGDHNGLKLPVRSCQERPLIANVNIFYGLSESLPASSQPWSLSYLAQVHLSAVKSLKQAKHCSDVYFIVCRNTCSWSGQCCYWERQPMSMSFVAGNWQGSCNKEAKSCQNKAR